MQYVSAASAPAGNVVPVTQPPSQLLVRDVVIKPPLVSAAGALDPYAIDVDWRCDFQALAPLGAITTKTATIVPRAGNPEPWVDLYDGDQRSLINSVGLANPGIAATIEQWRNSARPGQSVLLSLGGTEQELELMIAAAELAPWIHGYELNLSCPNVSSHWIPAADPAHAAALVAVARARTDRPVIAKLSAASDIVAVARAVVAAGADALTLVNTLPARVLDDDGAPVLGSADVGISGRALHAVALRCVALVAPCVDVPIIACGGVDGIPAARRMFGAGASAVGIGTAAAVHPIVLEQLAEMF